MKKILFLTSLILLTLIHSFESALANEKDSQDSFKSLDYPELQVTPRASERLKMEATSEYEKRWQTHWPIQISALSTFIAGIVAQGQIPNNSNPEKESENAKASQLAGIVGGTWLIASGLLMSNYTPYKQGWDKIKNSPTSSKREDLTRERLAEEYIRIPSSLASKLEWMSLISNLAISAYLGGRSSGKGSDAAAIAACMSFTPILFSYYWHDVYENQEIYKKKIFAPISLQPFASSSQGLVVGLSGSWSF